MTKRQGQPAQHAWYQDSLAHLVDELRRLDTLIQRHIATHRPQRLAAQGMAAAKGVYITHDEVDALLDQEDADDAQPRAVASDHLDTTIAAKMSASAEQGIFLSLPYVAQLFACPRSRCKPSSCVWLRNCDASTIRSMRTSRMTLPAKGPVSISSWISSVRPKPNGGAPAPRCSPTRRRCFAMAFSTR